MSLDDFEADHSLTETGRESLPPREAAGRKTRTKIITVVVRGGEPNIYVTLLARQGVSAEREVHDAEKGEHLITTATSSRNSLIEALKRMPGVHLVKRPAKEVA